MRRFWGCVYPCRGHDRRIQRVLRGRFLHFHVSIVAEGFFTASTSQATCSCTCRSKISAIFRGALIWASASWSGGLARIMPEFQTEAVRIDLFNSARAQTDGNLAFEVPVVNDLGQLCARHARHHALDIKKERPSLVGWQRNLELICELHLLSLVVVGRFFQPLTLRLNSVR